MGDGISTVALSVSTSSSGASSAMTSPSRTSTFTISASVRPSPRSGNLKSRAMGTFTEPEERHGFPGALRTWGVWGPFRGPHLEGERVAGGGDHARDVGDVGPLAREAGERHVVGGDACDRRLQR